MRRAFGVWVAGLLCSLLLLSACSSNGTKKAAGINLPVPEFDTHFDKSKLSKELNVFNWTEYLPEDVIKDFERVYGVKVNYDTYSSNEELHAKLKAGGSGYDVVFPSDYMVQVLKHDDLLSRLDQSLLPNLPNINPRFRQLAFDPANDYSVPYMWGTTGIVIDSAQVDPATVTSWGDLWRPEFKGKLVMPDDAREMIGIALRLNGHSMNTQDPALLSQAKAKLLELKPNIKAFNSDNPKEMLLSGEVVAGVVWSGEAAKAMIDNPKVTYVIPKEGSTIWMDNLAIPKGAPHAYTAAAFINFLLEPAVSARLSLAYPYGNPNQAAQKYIPKEQQESPAVSPSEDALKRTEWIQDLGDSANQLFDQTWTELKGQ